MHSPLPETTLGFRFAASKHSGATAVITVGFLTFIPKGNDYSGFPTPFIMPHNCTYQGTSGLATGKVKV